MPIIKLLILIVIYHTHLIVSLFFQIRLKIENVKINETKKTWSGFGESEGKD